MGGLKSKEQKEQSKDEGKTKSKAEQRQFGIGSEKSNLYPHLQMIAVQSFISV